MPCLPVQGLSRKLLLVGLILFLLPEFPLRAVAQASLGSSLQTLTLRQLIRNSGYIFVGKVIAVERDSATGPDSVATMRVTFRVQQAIRGIRTGQTLVVREWAGLWEFGGRYRPGEPELLFLYPPSRLGLTSPVGGTSGHFAMDKNGQIVLAPERIVTLALQPATEAVWRAKGRVSSHEFADAIRHISED